MLGLPIRSLSQVSAASAGFTLRALAAGNSPSATRRKTATSLRTVAALLAVLGLAGISLAKAQTAHLSAYRNTARTVASTPDTAPKSEISLKAAPITGDFGAVPVSASTQQIRQAGSLYL